MGKERGRRYRMKLGVRRQEVQAKERGRTPAEPYGGHRAGRPHQHQDAHHQGRRPTQVSH